MLVVVLLVVSCTRCVEYNISLATSRKYHTVGVSKFLRDVRIEYAPVHTILRCVNSRPPAANVTPAELLLTVVPNRLKNEATAWIICPLDR